MKDCEEDDEKEEKEEEEEGLGAEWRPAMRVCKKRKFGACIYLSILSICMHVCSLCRRIERERERTRGRK